MAIKVRHELCAAIAFEGVKIGNPKAGTDRSFGKRRAPQAIKKGAPVSV